MAKRRVSRTPPPQRAPRPTSRQAQIAGLRIVAQVERLEELNGYVLARGMDHADGFRARVESGRESIAIIAQKIRKAAEELMAAGAVPA
jgi:hypothetical protein